MFFPDRAAMGRRHPAFAVIVVLIALAPAMARGQAALSTTTYALTLSTPPQNCAPVDAGRKTLFIENILGGSYSVGYCADDTGTCTPAIGSAGTSVLAPGGADDWTLGTAPKAVNCIAAGSETVTIRSQK